MDEAYINEQITVLKAQIAAYNSAINFLASNPTRNYTLDTGQSRQDVTRYDLPNLQAARNSLYNDLTTFQARLNGASVVMQPSW